MSERPYVYITFQNINLKAQLETFTAQIDYESMRKLHKLLISTPNLSDEDRDSFGPMFYGSWKEVENELSGEAEKLVNAFSEILQSLVNMQASKINQKIEDGLKRLNDASK